MDRSLRSGNSASSHSCSCGVFRGRGSDGGFVEWRLGGLVAAPRWITEFGAVAQFQIVSQQAADKEMFFQLFTGNSVAQHKGATQDFDFRAQFLAQFATQALLRIFASMQAAAGRYPVGRAIALVALDEKQRVSLGEQDGAHAAHRLAISFGHAN